MNIFKRDDKYNMKLFEYAMFDDKNVILDATINIILVGSKWKAYNSQVNAYIQFPRNLRNYFGQQFIADIIEVIRSDKVTKYYRAMPKSIRKYNSNIVIA